MSIATALTALTDDVSAAKAAITAKGGTAPSGTADMADAIAAIPSGGITPSGNINITDTNVTDVTNYATATIVDADLVASNIKEGVNILGVVGTFAGGGGGLPSVISKIDSGSFTPTTDTTGSSYTIQHNLGVVPKEFSIWTEDNDAYAPYANQTLISTFARVTQINDSATIVIGGWYGHLNRRTAGDLTTFANTVRSHEAGNLATATYIKWNSANRYKAGCTYYWIAWA